MHWLAINVTLMTLDKLLTKFDKKVSKSFADSRGLIYYECSAKTGENVKELFVDLMSKIAVTQQSNFSGIEGISMTDSKRNPSKGKLTSCCTS